MILPASNAHAGDAFAAGLLGGLIGAAIAQPVYPVYPAYPAYPVYAAPPPAVIYHRPVVVYDEPVYPAPVYARPAYPYPQRRSLADVQGQSVRPTPDKPHVVTYDETVGGQVATAGIEPWSQAWFDYCHARFRTFDDQTGTFIGYDHQRHFCTAN